MERKIVQGIPLSLDKIIEGEFYWLEDYDGSKKNVILGNEEQDPNMLLYKDNVKAYVVKKGGYLTHLAIVCRELNIPLYIVGEELESGDYITILPIRRNYRNILSNVSDKFLFELTRKFAPNEMQEFDALRYVLEESISFVKDMKKYVKDVDILEIKNKFKKDLSIHVLYKIEGLRTLIEEVINNPNKIYEKLKEDDSLAASFIAKYIGEIATHYLIEKVGFEKAMRSINRHNPYWFNISDRYIIVRFKTDPNKIKEILCSMKAKKSYITLEEPYESLAKLIALCAEKYESKNYKI